MNVLKNSKNHQLLNYIKQQNKMCTVTQKYPNNIQQFI